MNATISVRDLSRVPQRLVVSDNPAALFVNVVFSQESLPFGLTDE